MRRRGRTVSNRFRTGGLCAMAFLGSAAAAACGDIPGDGGTSELGSTVVTQWNDSTELFLEYPPPVAGEHTGNWAIHLTARSSYEPIREGVVTVRFTPASGSGAAAEQTFTIEKPLRDGVFLLDPLIDKSGTYSVELEVSSPQAHSSHLLRAVTVYDSREEAPGTDEGGQDVGVVAFLKEQQWVIPFDVEPAADREVRPSVSVPAEIVPPDGALFEVSAPVDGIAPADANRNAPSVGAHVRKDQVLAVLAPTTQEGGFAEMLGRVERLEREVTRAERLDSVGAIPRRRLEEARHDLEIAHAELEAMGGAPEGDFLLRLRAPITGVIAGRDFVPGGRVSAGAPLFTVVDPETAWLRAQVPGTRVASLTQDPARFTVEGSTEVHETSPPLSIGMVMDEQSRTVPVVYEARGPGGRLTFGQIATALVPVNGGERGLALPESAILDDNGTPVAYVQIAGESFQRRVLTLGPSDGTWTLVRDGVRSGEMVVITGAYQVRLASLSGNEFAGGHTH